MPQVRRRRHRLVGGGKETFLYEYVPGYFVQQKHVQEKRACSCGQYIATAEPSPRPIEKSHYGPGFIAHLIVMKCGDSILLYRLAKQYQRLGIPMGRSTLNATSASSRLYSGSSFSAAA
jgi:transposase